MATRTMAFFFTVTYEDGSEQRFWSKPLHMALWERKNKGRSFLPADGMPSMDSMFWLAYKAGRDLGLFDEKIMDEWASKITSFEFAEDDADDVEGEDDAATDDGPDPTQQAE